MAINWNLGANSANPLQDVLGGLQIGQNVRQNQRNARIEELQDSLASSMRSGQGNFDLGSSADFNALSALAPELAQQQMRSFSEISGTRRQRYVDTMMNAKAALQMNNPDGAMSYLDGQIAAVQADGGDPSNTQYVRNLVASDPKAALDGLMKMEAALAQTGAIQLSPQDKKKAERRVQSTENLDGGSLITYSDGTQDFKPYGREVVNQIKQYQRQFKPDLTAGQIKSVLDTQTSAMESRKLAGQAQTLASKISKMDAMEGVFGKGSELWKNIWGSEDEVSALRKNYTRLVNEFVIKSLPPGIASDRDVALIREGYLEPTANKEQVAGFLESLSRVQQDAALYDDFKAAFLERSGGIQVADRPFDYKGVKIEEGESLDDAYTKWIDDKYGDKRKEAAAANVINWGDL